MITKPAPPPTFAGEKWVSTWLYKMQSERVKVSVIFLSSCFLVVMSPIAPTRKTVGRRKRR